MPKITEGQYALGGLTVFAIWVFVVLPFLYQVPIAHKNHDEETKAAASQADRNDQKAGALVTVSDQVLAQQNASPHHKDELDKDRGEFWTAKLTDWLLAAFTLALVFFTYKLVQSTNRLWLAGERQIGLAGRALDAQLRPVLTVQIPESAKSLWNQKTFKGELMFTVKNSGQTAAFLKAIYRSWDVCECSRMPNAVEWPDRPEPGIWKENFVAIGPGQCSSQIKAVTSILCERRRAAYKDWIFFYGYLEFEDLAGNKYLAGFCELFDIDNVDIGFHIPWPENEHGNKYNYQKCLPPTGRPVASAP
jgi:hypothetical protein